MRFLLLAAALVASSASGQPSVPQTDAPAADSPRAKLLAADVNKDGKWDKAEWLAAGRREMGFGFCDTNKDGFVDAAELKACADKARAMGMSGL